jgi:Kef-type K+ transport system membrane component KefB
VIAATVMVAAAPEGGAAAGPILLALVAIFVATKALGEVAQRFGQPTVLGELIAGVLLGGSVLGLVDPDHPVIHVMAELGVIILLFAIGLETELASLIRVGPAATTVAVAGVAAPFALGYYAAIALGLPPLHAMVCGAALCATSVGITARVLAELGWLESNEGKVILGAAVIDDIIGLIILAIVASLVGGKAVTAGSIAGIAGVAVAFVGLAVVLGSLLAPPVFRMVEKIRAANVLGLFGLAFAFLLAWLAQRAGSAMIVGAFAAGLVLYRLPQRHEIEKATTAIGHFFVPVFFAAVGAAVDLRALADSRALTLGAVLIACGIVGKVVAGYAPWWFNGDKLFVGIGMVPRGEVGLIFAQMGLAAGAVTAGEYGALMLMVLGTTFVTPPALAWRARQHARKLRDDDLPGEGGIDDLVAGTRGPRETKGPSRGASRPPSSSRRSTTP